MGKHNGVYGPQMSAFPELLLNFPYFDMPALQGADFGPRVDVQSVRGVFQCTGGRMVKDGNGNLIRERSVRFWTKADLQVGRFIEADGDVYRVGMPDNEWQLEGGFTVYDLHKVVGGDGRAAVAPPVNMGGRDFA